MSKNLPTMRRSRNPGKVDLRTKVIAPIGDPNFDKVVLLMHMDGTNGSTTFTDVKGKTVSPFGNAVISTAQSKFGGASGYFDGNGDYLEIVDSSDWAFGNGDFTIESFLRLNTVSGAQFIIGQHGDSNNSNRSFALYYDGNVNLLRFFPSITGVFDVNLTLQDTNALVADVWYHVAITRSASTLYLFVDGTLKATKAISEALFNSNLPLRIGGDNSNVQFLNGYLEELRITKVARYITNFAPPSSPFPDN